MVEGTPLLRAQAGNRLEGSNPFGSANTRFKIRQSAPRGAFFFLVSKGFTEESDFQRLPNRRKSVSKQPASLSERLSREEKRSKIISRF